MENNITPINTDKDSLLIYSHRTLTATHEEKATSGRMANALSRAISFNREPSLFDSLAVQERDILIRSDAEYSLHRNYKPVELTPEEFRMTCALSFGISQEIAQEEIKNAIAKLKSNKGGVTVTRYIDITEMARFLYNRADNTQKAYVIRDLFNLSKKVQILMLGENKEKLKPVVSPLIKIDPEGISFKEIDGTKVSIPDFAKFLKTSSPEEIANSIEGINVGFGTAFFFNLDTQWGYLPIKLFDVLRANKTELFQVLFTTILTNYIRIRNAAKAAEANERKKIQKEVNSTGKISKEEYAERIRIARQEALIYPLNVSSIKAKVSRDYESTKQYRALFWKDLDKAAKNLEEINLITGYKRRKGVKGQDRIDFYIDDKYNFGSPLKEQTKELLKKPKGGEQLMPF